MIVQYKIHTRYKPPAPRVKAGVSNFISISMLADSKAPPAPSYYGIIGKRERGHASRVALVEEIKKMV